MIKVVFIGHTTEWESREAAEMYFSALLKEADGIIPYISDRIYRVLDNLRAGKEECTDFE